MIMNLYNELNCNEKYAISNLMDGIVTLIREAKYHPSDTEIIGMLIKIYRENNYLDIDELTNLIKE